MTGEKPNNFLSAVPLVLAVGLVIAMSLVDKLHLDPSAAVPFHARAAAAINAMPRLSGDWLAEADYTMDETAIKLLQVNAYLNRSYRNIRTGQKIEVLLVQCRDARAMQGHFPPVCYASNGCAVRTLGEAKHWTVKGLNIPGLEYEIVKPGGTKYIIRDFFILPNGKFAYDMTSVIAAAKNYQELVFGGTQVQVIFPAGVSDRQRDAIFSDLMGSYSDLLDVLRGAQWKGAKGASPTAATTGAGFPDTGRTRLN